MSVGTKLDVETEGGDLVPVFVCNVKRYVLSQLMRFKGRWIKLKLSYKIGKKWCKKSKNFKQNVAGQTCGCGLNRK